MDFARGCCQRAAQADRLAKNNPSSSAIAMRRALPLAFDPELSSLIALAVLSRASSSMGFPILAIDETFMNRRRSFERSLVKRSNYGPARFAKTRAGNLTIFMGPRLPYYLACSWLKKSMIERMRSRTASSDPQGRSRKESSSLSRLFIADTTLFGILRRFLLSVVGAGTVGGSCWQPQIGISAPW